MKHTTKPTGQGFDYYETYENGFGKLIIQLLFSQGEFFEVEGSYLIAQGELKLKNHLFFGAKIKINFLDLTNGMLGPIDEKIYLKQTIWSDLLDYIG